MRLTNKLFAQHIGHMFKKHWQVQGKKIPLNTGAVEQLQKHGINVKDPVEVIFPKKPRIELEIFQKPEINTSNHVDCYDFRDTNVFVEGINQAQIITNTLVVDEFPIKIQNAIKNQEITNQTNKNLFRGILTSCLLDAYQEKLPKQKVPGKPMYNLPRIYGIPANRKCQLLISKLLSECSKLNTVSDNKKIVDNANFEIFLKKNEELLRFNITADTLVLNQQKTEYFKENIKGNIPDIFPMTFTIGLPNISISKCENLVFSGAFTSKYFPHIIISHFNPEEVKNLYGTPVTTSQLQGRTLLKAFVAAFSKAKCLNNDDKKDLNTPIVVHAVQTDGKRFHFGIFQLNTMDLTESNETKNFWFQGPILDLYDICDYVQGRPVLEGYNSEVFKILNAFYVNC